MERTHLETSGAQIGWSQSRGTGGSPEEDRPEVYADFSTLYRVQAAHRGILDNPRIRSRSKFF